MKKRHVESSSQAAKSFFQYCGVSSDTKFSDLKKQHIEKIRTCLKYDKFTNFQNTSKSIEQNYFELQQRRVKR